MTPEEARARMLRLWRLFGDGGAFRVLTTQRCVNAAVPMRKPARLTD